MLKTFSTHIGNYAFIVYISVKPENQGHIGVNNEYCREKTHY